MGAMASQITSLTMVYSTVYSGADQRKHQSSASLAFVQGIHRWPHSWPVTRKVLPFDDVIMVYPQSTRLLCILWGRHVPTITPAASEIKGDGWWTVVPNRCAPLQSAWYCYCHAFLEISKSFDKYNGFYEWLPFIRIGLIIASSIWSIIPGGFFPFWDFLYIPFMPLWDWSHIYSWFSPKVSSLTSLVDFTMLPRFINLAPSEIHFKWIGVPMVLIFIYSHLVFNSKLKFPFICIFFVTIQPTMFEITEDFTKWNWF